MPDQVAMRHEVGLGVVGTDRVLHRLPPGGDRLERGAGRELLPVSLIDALDLREGGIGRRRGLGDASVGRRITHEGQCDIFPVLQQGAEQLVHRSHPLDPAPLRAREFDGDVLFIDQLEDQQAQREQEHGGHDGQLLPHLEILQHTLRS